MTPGTHAVPTGIPRGGNPSFPPRPRPYLPHPPCGGPGRGVRGPVLGSRGAGPFSPHAWHPPSPTPSPPSRSHTCRARRSVPAAAPAAPNNRGGRGPVRGGAQRGGGRAWGCRARPRICGPLARSPERHFCPRGARVSPAPDPLPVPPGTALAEWGVPAPPVPSRGDPSWGVSPFPRCVERTGREGWRGEGAAFLPLPGVWAAGYS